MIWDRDKVFWSQGLDLVAGIDEVGRGCLSGPVVAAAFMANSHAELPAVRDSKKVSAGQRQKLYQQLLPAAIDFAVGLASPQEIDELNILEATRLAMLRAVKGLKITPELLLIDGNQAIFSDIPQETVVKGDAKYGNIASASIIAKVTRDAVMERMHIHFPAYSFDKNKGYGTGEHFQALNDFGPCPIHRFSFNGVGQLRLPI